MQRYDEFKARTETIQWQIFEAKKGERANALKELQLLCERFGSVVGNLNGVLAEGGKN